jgi:hypothetical protein
MTAAEGTVAVVLAEWGVASPGQRDASVASRVVRRGIARDARTAQVGVEQAWRRLAARIEGDR